MPEPDIALVGQDPRFGGGARAQLEAFWNGSVELGRSPELLYLEYRGLRGASIEGSPLCGASVPPTVAWLDGVNQAVAGRRLAGRVRHARSAWVVATAASHGYAAARSERPYACWIGTSLDDEWAGRRSGLQRSRRLALATSAPVLRRLERRVLGGARRVYATSEHSQATLSVAAGLGDSEIGILPIPVDIDRLTPLGDDEWSASLARPTLVFVGRGDDPRKNVSLLVDAFALVRARLPDARLRLVGKPPATRLPDGVDAVGHMPALADAVRDAALLVVPSRQEGFGIVAAEALACGVPVVSTPCGGPEGLIRDSGGGRVLASFDPDELAEALVDLLEDAGTLLAMRRRGREFVVREHSPARFRTLLEAAFEDLDELAR